MNDSISASIYVVDDDEDTRSIVSSTVSILPAIVRQFADGPSVLASCSEILPDVIILDVMMPGMDGDEVCRKVRQLPGGEYIQIIMLTARDTVKDMVGSFEGGANDYLTKPFDYQELIARVKALLRVRELTLDLQEKNIALEEAQNKIIAQERQLLTQQLAGTAAHELGQPLAAIMLNCHLLETLPPGDERTHKALQAIKLDSEKMKTLIEQLKTADAGSKEEYFEGQDILKLKD